MSARTPEPCDGLGGEHGGPIHFYLTGWKCDAHSPWAMKGLPKPKPGPCLQSGA